MRPPNPPARRLRPSWAAACPAPTTTTSRLMTVGSANSPADLMRPDLDLERADRSRIDAQHVARLHLADPVRRAGVVNVTRIEGVERRGELDQPADVVDQVLGVGGLLELVVVVQRDDHVVGV